MNEIVITQEEETLSGDIFRRLEQIPLVDRYEAYQLLDDEWEKIAVDLEIIQSEGFDAAKKTDPNMVFRKKEGRDQEIQEGWRGRIFPFELIQETLLKEESGALKAQESRLAEIPAEYEEIADSMSEEEKDGEYYAEGSFVAKEVTKKIKELKQDPSPEAVSLREKLTSVEKRMKEEKNLKAQIKKDTAALTRGQRRRSKISRTIRSESFWKRNGSRA